MTIDKHDAGVTMLEVLIAGVILGIAVLSTLVLIPTTSKLEQAVESEEIARMVLRKVMEDLYARSAQDAFALYNQFGADDIDGVDSGPGAAFEVPPLEGVHPDGFVGHIEFPPHSLQNDNKDVMLDETMDDPVMCMPRDLDGDGKITKSVDSRTIVILPVRVTLDWRSAAGEQHLEAVIILGPK